MRVPDACRFIPVLLLLAAGGVRADDAKLLEEARGVASSVPPQLLAVLQEEMARGGPAGAVEVCRDQAPQLAKAASERTGWQVRRVSLKNRNPKAVPDPWERGVLEDFDRRAAAGESPATIEKGEVQSENGTRVYRYMKALPVQPLCLACHGTAEQISAETKARLATLYPDDRGTGYALGQIRGAMTIKRAL
jgi:hypothetical protein